MTQIRSLRPTPFPIDTWPMGSGVSHECRDFGDPFARILGPMQLVPTCFRYIAFLLCSATRFGITCRKTG